MFHNLIPGNTKFSKGFDEKDYSNVLKVFFVCLELPNDSDKHFGFVVDESSELVYNIKLRC